MAGFFFGTAAIFIRFIIGLDALTIGFYRLLIASSILLAIKFLLGQKIKITMPGTSFLRLSILGFLLGFHFALFIQSVKITTVINATVLVNTTPAITLLIYWAWYRERPPAIKIIGLLLSLTGVFLISIFDIRFSFSSTVGDLLSLIAATLWAIYLIIGKPIREKDDILSTMPIIYFMGCIALMILSLVFGEFVIPTAEQWLPLLGLSIFPTAIGHTLHFSSMKSLKPYQTSVLALLEPITATLLALVFFDEIPAPPFFVGAIVVLVGIYLIIRIQ